jgi:hypothetical protein
MDFPNRASEAPPRMVLKRLDGTGGWFTQLQSFKDWRGSGNSEEHVDSSVLPVLKYLDAMVNPEPGNLLSGKQNLFYP